MSRWSRGLVAVLASVLVAGACSDDDDASGTPSPTSTSVPVAVEPTPSPTVEPTAAPTPPPTATPAPPPERIPTVAVLPAVGALIPIPNVAVPDGWTVEEFAFGGRAIAYEPVGEVGPDGAWDVAEGRAAEYRTRMLVRRPPAADFSGIVLVEWMNVSAGADVAPDYGFISEEIFRRGHAWVGVSVQEVAVNGTESDLVGGGLIDRRGLAAIRPERYGDLVHPGDAFAYDIFTQAGALLDGLGAISPLGDLAPTRLIAMGESQSAAFMVGYLNTAHLLAGRYDGYLVHSRGGGAPGPTAERLDFNSGGVKLRTDLDAPVFVFEAETDVGALGFASARQPDTDLIRTWEVAGTAHTDAYTLAASAGFDRDAGLGVIIGCTTPINDGPHHETVQAAVRHLVAWVTDATPPPTGPLLEVDAGGALVRDELGIAVGGIRTPPVEVPLRVLSGDPGPDGGACFLFGQTLPLADEVLTALYPSPGDHAAALESSAAAAVEGGWLLPEDAATMVAEELARAEELGVS